MINVLLKLVCQYFTEDFFKKDFIYLTEREPVREGTQAGAVGGRSRLLAEKPEWGLIPERWDHALS